MARTDLSGRVRGASLLRVLGWLPGSGIDLDVAGYAIVIRVGPDGRHKIGALGEIGLPASLRAMAGIAAESLVFMAALVDRGLLVIHPARAITRALHRTYAGLIGEIDAG